MTTTLATIPLTYAGTDLQPANLQIFLELVLGLSEAPSVRGTDIIVPALAGRVEGRRVNDFVAIELRGWVRADPATTTTATQRASYRANMKALRALFATNRARADLVATLEDGTTATISARPLNLVLTELVPSEFANISIELAGNGDWVIT